VPEARVQDFPLFPLGIVVLPWEAVPLRIFEERFKTMINECLERESEFGIVWLSDDELRKIGCACRIERVLERDDEGRMNLLTRGTQPFRVLERRSELPYPAALVEFLTDLDEPADAEIARSAHAAYGDLVRMATDRDPSDDELAQMSAYQMAATVDFGLDAKQGLLDLRSENARLQLAARLFRAAVKRLEYVDRAQARARSNGKVRFN
jgi:Lon protease-like protein